MARVRATNTNTSFLGTSNTHHLGVVTQAKQGQMEDITATQIRSVKVARLLTQQSFYQVP